MKRKLKLGVIEVLNVLPVYYGVITGQTPIPCQIVTGKVTELNRKLANGEIDISVISSFEYAQNPELYYVFPNLSVGADGPVHSIYLFLNKPINELNHDLIKLTEFSLTSVRLVQYLLQELDVTFTQEKTKAPTGELLIADEAIQRFYSKQDPYVYDLSKLWKDKTGLPFVFALWVCRRDCFDKNRDDILETYQALIASKKRSKNLYRQMAEEKYQGVFPNADDCEKYLRNIHYELSERYQKGFELFQQKLFQMKKLHKISPLQFLPGIESETST